MHTCKVDIHEEGLQDDCAACEDHGDHPFSDLDNTMLRNLAYRNYHYRFNEDRDVRADFLPRSTSEAVAMVEITNMMERMGKLFSVAPEIMVSYLQERWRIKGLVYLS